jgi:hypothetical protein
VVTNQARGAAFAASPRPDFEVAEAIPAKTARPVERWRRMTKSSTEARNCGSAAAVRSVSGPIPLSARNRPSRSGSPAMKDSA